MKNIDALLHETELFAQSALAHESTGHDWWHIVRVRNIAKKIQAKEGGDLNIIDLALILHDVGDRKVIQKTEDDYSIAESFLRSHDTDNEMMHTVMEIIKNMSFSKSLDQSPASAASIEFQIVQDSDRLDALGAIGIARAFAYGGSKARPLYDPEYTPQNFKSRDDYVNAKSSSLHHFDEKLLRLKELLNTATAKEIAANRDAYMREFQIRFLDEWNGVK